MIEKLQAELKATLAPPDERITSRAGGMVLMKILRWRRGGFVKSEIER